MQAAPFCVFSKASRQLLHAVFEEGGLPTTEYSDIYGLMTYHGVPKPGWRAFQLLNGAGDHRVPTTLASEQQVSAWDGEGACVTEANTNMAGFTLSSAKASDSAECCAKCQALDSSHCSFWSFHAGSCVFKSSDAGRTKAAGYTSGSRVAPGNSSSVSSPLAAFATVNGSTATTESLQVFLSLFGNPDISGAVKARTVTVTVKHALGDAPSAVTATVIDPTHGNSLAAWKKMGSPKVPSASQLRHLMVASEVAPAPVAGAALRTSASGTSTSVSVPMVENSAVRLNFA